MLALVRVAVVHPPLTIAEDFIDYPFVANLGAVQLAAAVRAAGHDTRLVDCFAMAEAGFCWRDDGRARLGAPTAAVLEAIGEVDAAVVVLTPFHRPWRHDDVVAPFLEGLAERCERILLTDGYQSGQHYVESPGMLDRYPMAESYTRYEAEVTIPALLESGERGVFGGASPDLSELPAPAWDLVDLEAYWAFHRRFGVGLGRPAWAFPLGARSLPLLTTRGCPFRCIHCSSNPGLAPGAPKTQRRLPEANVAEQVQALEDLGADTLYVLDELINVRKSHYRAFLDAIEATDLRFEVPNGFRADYLDAALFGRMRGRVSTVSVSAESGSERVVRDVVGKELDLKTIERAAEDAQRAGVPLLVHYMIGLPGESAAEINETLAFALDLFDRFGAEPAVQYATPLPGTELAEKVQLPVVEVDDWGPRFQQLPSPESRDVVAPETLATFMRTFERRIEASRGPQKLIMNVTYVCNNHCTFCAVGTRTQVDGHPSRQREILDKYRRHGVRLVDFDGGEPTLNPELVPLIRHAKRVGYERIHVTTNGRLCAYEEFAKKLVQSGVSSIAFSVHGPDIASHAREVGVAEAFGQTTEGIRHCVKHAPEGVALGMNITLTKTNFRKQPELAQLAWDLGLRWLNVQFLTPFGRATKRHAPDTAEAAAVTAAVIDEWKDRMKIQVINLPWCFLPKHEAHVAGDAGKLARHMVFVNNETVNLADYLAERRVRKPVCEGCPHSCFCGGFYELDDVPEPPWIVTAESLTKKTRPELEAR